MDSFKNRVAFAKQIIFDIENNKINSLRDIELVQFDL